MDESRRGRREREVRAWIVAVVRDRGAVDVDEIAGLLMRTFGYRQRRRALDYVRSTTSWPNATCAIRFGFVVPIERGDDGAFLEELRRRRP